MTHRLTKFGILLLDSEQRGVEQVVIAGVIAVEIFGFGERAARRWSVESRLGSQL